MAAESVTTKTPVSDEIFEIPAGKKKQDALDFAELATDVSRSLLTTIIRGEQGAENIAWAARFLVECAQACYESVARKS
jgi:hypothetical protein